MIINSVIIDFDHNTEETTHTFSIRFYHSFRILSIKSAIESQQLLTTNYSLVVKDLLEELLQNISNSNNTSILALNQTLEYLNKVNVCDFFIKKYKPSVNIIFNDSVIKSVTLTSKTKSIVIKEISIYSAFDKLISHTADKLKFDIFDAIL